MMFNATFNNMEFGTLYRKPRYSISSTRCLSPCMNKAAECHPFEMIPH